MGTSILASLSRGLTFFWPLESFYAFRRFSSSSISLEKSSFRPFSFWMAAHLLVEVVVFWVFSICF